MSNDDELNAIAKRFRELPSPLSAAEIRAVERGLRDQLDGQRFYVKKPLRRTRQDAPYGRGRICTPTLKA